jgi:hypothetical protein
MMEEAEGCARRQCSETRPGTLQASATYEREWGNKVYTHRFYHQVFT